MMLRSYWNSHYKSGFIIGSIYILCNITILIFNLYRLINENEDLKHRKRFILANVEMGLSLTSALISAFYIVAIKKKYHTFMRPALIPFIFDFYYSSKLLFMSCLKAERNNESSVSTTILSIICLWVIGLQLAIFWSSYILYSQIRNGNTGKSEIVTQKLPLPK